MEHTVPHIEDSIEEYLQYRNYSSTLEFFRQDRQRGEMEGLSPAHSSSNNNNSMDPYERSQIISQFCSAFTEGNHVDLFLLWQSHVPSSFQKNFDPNDPTLPDLNTPENANTKQAMCLEFYLNLHFAIYPFRDENMIKCRDAEDASKRCAKAMAVFRRYLTSERLEEERT